MREDSDGGGGWTSVTDLPAKRWVLLTGDRGALAGLLTLALVALSYLLIVGGVVYVGDGSTYATVLASGLLGAVVLRVATVTLYTVSVGSFIPPEERVGQP